MKKDGIQTRNRKLTSKVKSKKRPSGMDFFKPFDTRFSPYSGMATANPYFANPMTQYYGHTAAAAAAMPAGATSQMAAMGSSQFMPSSAVFPLPSPAEDFSAFGGGGGGTGTPPTSMVGASA